MASNDPDSGSGPTQESSRQEAPPYRKRSISFATRHSPPPSKHHYPSDDDDQVSPGHVSSADEITPIASNERSTGAKRRSYSTAAGTDPGNKQGNQNDSGVDDTDNSQGQGVGDDGQTDVRKGDKGKRPAGGEEEEKSWWRDVVDKYGAVELENKGSVARDHLALGTFIPLQNSVIIAKTDHLGNRANIPRLASDFPGVCLNRHCSHAVISSQYHYQRARRVDPEESFQ